MRKKKITVTERDGIAVLVSTTAFSSLQINTAIRDSVPSNSQGTKNDNNKNDYEKIHCNFCSKDREGYQKRKLWCLSFISISWNRGMPLSCSHSPWSAWYHKALPPKRCSLEQTDYNCHPVALKHYPSKKRPLAPEKPNADRAKERIIW